MSALPNSIRSDLDILDSPQTASYDEEATRALALERCNRLFSELNPLARVEWALEHLPSNHVLTSSFDAQAAVSLHLVTRVKPDIPVILIDTGYLFPETYRFIDELTDRLQLNLRVYRAELSPAWQEARYGQRRYQFLKGLNAYNEETKVEMMRREVCVLGANTWFAGLLRKPCSPCAAFTFLDWAGGRWNVLQIAEWTDREVHYYLMEL